VDCPVNEHQRGLASFQVDPIANRYYCTYCKPRGASLLDLVIDLKKAATFAEATSYLRKSLGLETQPYAFEIDAENGALDTEDEVDEVEKSLVQMLGMTKPAGYTKYCSKRKIPPLGANVTTDGNLYVPVRDCDLILRGILEIDVDGARLVHIDEPLNGSSIAIGHFTEAPVIGFTLEWESAVALHIITGGMPCLAYLDPSNLLDSVDMFISENTRGICIFATPHDSIEMIDLTREYMEGLGKKLHLQRTLDHDYCERYTSALRNLKNK
jgi:hypothetical protein